MRTLTTSWRLAPLALLALLVAGCQPDIGDECTTSVDCSSYGERLCDTTQPGGYCTIFNCEPDTCPDEATCVAFYLQEDPACGPIHDGLASRFARSFCLYTCEDDSDCRDGYECIRPLDRRAFVLDGDTDTDDPQDERVCLAAGTLSPLPVDVPDRCRPAEDGPPLDPWYPDAGVGGTAGSGGSAGSGGAGGSAGSGGAGGSAGSGGAGGSAGSGGSGGSTGAGGTGGSSGSAGSSAGGSAGAGGG